MARTLATADSKPPRYMSISKSGCGTSYLSRDDALCNEMYAGGYDLIETIIIGNDTLFRFKLRDRP